MIDSKIEKLLISYKQKDEQAKRRAGNIDAEKALGKKNLLDKFGFSDDEESVIEQVWKHLPLKKRKINEVQFDFQLLTLFYFKLQNKTN